MMRISSSRRKSSGFVNLSIYPIAVYSLIDKFAWGSNDGFAVLVEEWGEACTVAVLCKQIVNTSLGIDDDTCIL